MVNRKKSIHEFGVEELDKELIARGIQTSDEEKFNFEDTEGTPARHAVLKEAKKLYKTTSASNKELESISTWDLSRVIIFNIRNESDFSRGSSDWEERLDWYEIPDEQILQNSGCVAAVCSKDSLIDSGKGYYSLKTKIYGEVFNLCDAEPFYDQPVSIGFMYSGFLVSGDVIATTSHVLNGKNINDFCFIFGYRMSGPREPEIRVPVSNIYRGIEIIHHEKGENGDGWALIKLDRKVQGQAIARLSGEGIFSDEPLYVIGHPLGLPLKYTAGASIIEITSNNYFTAGLNIYSGNEGSPVFDLDTHELVGMVVQGVYSDFRWSGKGWLSVIQPGGTGSICMGISGIIPFIK